MTYLSHNFSAYTVEVWEWISKLIPHLTGILIHSGINVKPC